MKLLESLPQDKQTQEQEFALAARIQKTPTEDLLNELVMPNMKEAFLYMKGVCHSKIDDDEIFSLCYKTLFRNAKRFRPGGIRFVAFAKAGIRGAVSRYWTGVDVVKNSKGIVSLERPNDYHIRGTPSEECFGSQEVASDIPEPTVDPEFGMIDIREKMEIVNEIMKSKLSEQEQMLMALVYQNGFNFQEIGNLLGITRSAAQSNHSKAVKKIRRELVQRRLLQES